jgi:pyruvate dehydrogenase E2 component (dihydrolipoamide acetyltransferase)
MKPKNMKISESIKFDLQRIVVSHKTLESWRSVPHVCYVYEPDITDFYEEYIKLAKIRDNAGLKISFNTIMLKVIAEGLLKAPSLNSCIEYNKRRAEGILHILESINISMPWLLADGRMITPVIHNAGKMSVNDISEYITKLSERIKKTNIDEMLYRTIIADTVDELRQFKILKVIGRMITALASNNQVKGLSGKGKKHYYKIPGKERLTEHDILNGTVTVSNIGSLYKEQRGFFTLLEVIPPQVFAVGIGSVQEKPGVYISREGKKEIGIRKTLPMCLAFDHRAVDFNAVIPFIKRLDELFYNPDIIHKW